MNALSCCNFYRIKKLNKYEVHTSQKVLVSVKNRQKNTDCNIPSYLHNHTCKNMHEEISPVKGIIKMLVESRFSQLLSYESQKLCFKNILLKGLFRSMFFCLFRNSTEYDNVTNTLALMIYK